MTIAGLWGYGDWRHVATGCTALVLFCKRKIARGPLSRILHSNASAVTKATSYENVLKKELECGPMLNVMVALPNIGGALCSTPQSLADAHY